MPFAPKVIETVRQLIGDPVLLHLDQVFLKPARHGAGTNWHQDNAYFKIADPLKGTALWTAVHDATVANGTLHVVPNAFRESLEHRRDPDSDHHIRCWPDESKAIPLNFSPGASFSSLMGRRTVRWAMPLNASGRAWRCISSTATKMAKHKADSVLASVRF